MVSDDQLDAIARVLIPRLEAIAEKQYELENGSLEVRRARERRERRRRQLERRLAELRDRAVEVYDELKSLEEPA